MTTGFDTLALPGVQMTPPPSGIRESVNRIALDLTGGLQEGEKFAFVAIPHYQHGKLSTNLAIVANLQRGEHSRWDVVGYVGKTWGEPIEAGAVIKWTLK